MAGDWASELVFLSAREVGERIRRRELSPVEVTRAVLDRIQAVQPELNAYITVLDEAALADAAAAETEIMRGDYRGPLHGVPIGLKDNYDTAAVRTTAASQVLEHNVPATDSCVAARFRAAGAILVGKNNLHEFAYGATTDSPYFGPTRNPYDPTRTPGGSSGGSAAAVAAGAGYVTTGSDTGGSTRLPAALCNVVGIKPTFGRVSKRGIFPISWSLDHPGPITRTVADNAIALAATAGYDPADPGCADVPVPDYVAALTGEVRGLRVGVPPASITHERVDPEVSAAFERAVETLTRLGATRHEIALPHFWHSRLVLWVLILADAFEVHRRHFPAAAAKYSPEVRRYVEEGIVVTAADYVRAQQARRLILDDYLTALRDVDVIVTPATAIPAPVTGQKQITVQGRLEDPIPALNRFTCGLNLAGLPALSVPAGFTAGGLPIGLQVAGRAFAEATVYRVADAFERATGYWRRRP